MIIDIVLPDRLLHSGEGKIIVFPASLGYMGVMDMHSPQIASISPGVVEIYNDNEQITDKFFVTAGFADVNDKKCTLLVDEAKNMSEINLSEMKAGIAELQKNSSSTDENNISFKKIATLQNQIDALENYLGGN